MQACKLPYIVVVLKDLGRLGCGFLCGCLELNAAGLVGRQVDLAWCRHVV
jgi:hypothetical protein